MTADSTMPDRPWHDWISKVPPVTFMFWVIKILATTLGETGGDAVSMQLHLGYQVASAIFLAFFVVALIGQLSVRRFHPFAYWLVVVATTTVGTTVSDFLDRSMHWGYVKSSIALSLGVLAVLAVWRLVAGRIEFERIANLRDEAFYWLTILVSNTLGTALGDMTADDLGLGFVKGALLFAGLILLIALAHRFTRISTAVLFWAAYVLTRPLGATLGDTLTKPHDEGGLALSRIASSVVIGVVMVALIAATSYSASRRIAAGRT